MQFWSPHYQKDVEALESEQRRFTRMLPRLKGVGYEEGLNKLGLFSLERQEAEDRPDRGVQNYERHRQGG